jgi:hypothetical protein
MTITLWHFDAGSGRRPLHQFLSHFRVRAERRPDRAQLVMALICWSFSSSMFKYLLVDHSLPAM